MQELHIHLQVNCNQLTGKHTKKLATASGSRFGIRLQNFVCSTSNGTAWGSVCVWDGWVSSLPLEMLVTWYEHTYGHPSEEWTRPPFNVTQCHRLLHGLLGYLW